MIVVHSLPTLTWVQVTLPTEDEIRRLIKDHDLSPQIAKELLHPSPRPTLVEKDNAQLAVIKIPIPRQPGVRSTTEIDFVTYGNTIITVSYDEREVLTLVHQQLQAGTISRSVDAISFQNYILLEIFAAIEGDIMSVEDELMEIETNIFSGNERKMVGTLAVTGRKQLQVFSCLSELAPVIRGLQHKQSGNIYTHKDVNERYHQIFDRLETSRMIHLELRRTNDTLLSTKQNEVMKSLTVITFLLLPLGVLASVFGMNAHIPYLHNNPDAYALIGLVMLLAFSITYLISRYKNWL